jgi:hypothetical protein
MSPREALEEWTERAAIIEYDGERPRRRAEAMAAVLLARQIGKDKALRVLRRGREVTT